MELERLMLEQIKVKQLKKQMNPLLWLTMPQRVASPPTSGERLELESLLKEMEQVHYLTLWQVTRPKLLHKQRLEQVFCTPTTTTVSRLMYLVASYPALKHAKTLTLNSDTTLNLNQ